MLLRLTLSNLAARKMRLALTVAAVALSVSLVVSVTGGFRTIEEAAKRFVSGLIGSADALVSRQGDARAGVEESLVEEFRRDRDVESAVGRLETDFTLLDAKGQAMPGRPAQVVGIRRPGDKEVDRLTINAGGWFETPDENSVVIDQVVSEKLQLKVGDTLKLPHPRGSIDLRVVGVVQKPGILAAQIQTIYVPIVTLQRFALPDRPDRVGRIILDLKPGVKDKAFADRWNPKLAQIDPSLKLKLTSGFREDMDRQMASVNLMGYLGGLVSMLAATFIVFSALSMGVTERQRTLAMLRAVGAYRSQIVALVVLEGIALAAIGVAVGVPLGWLWVKILVSLPKFQEFLGPVGVKLAPGGLWLACAGSLLAATAASLLPAWMASRVDPLDAMRPLANSDPSELPRKSIVVGSLLIFVDSLILFGPLTPLFTSSPIMHLAERFFGVTDAAQIDRSVRFYLHFGLGIPALFLGFFLLSPLFVWLTERLLGPIMAGVLNVRYAMLRQQLSTGIWRAAGTASALMVGLAILVVMQVQGHSALNSWKLPDKFPDVFIFSPIPLGPADQKKLAETPGIRDGQIMPIAIASPQFGSNLFAVVGAMVIPDATMFFGIDPELSLKMMELEFRNDLGQRVSDAEQRKLAREATDLLKQGRHVIVTDEFRQIRNLKRGDKIPLKTRSGTVDFTIAGIVWSPGMDVINSKFDLGRQFEQRTQASLFGSLDDARKEFGVEDVYLFAANLDYFLERDQMLAQVQQRLGKMNMRIGDVRQIKKSIQDGLTNLLLLVSTVAFAAMAVASLGVTNTIMASVRSRQWQFGVLRSIGVTRGQLLRLVVAEALLLGAVGIGLGLTAGLLMAINGKQFLLITTGFKSVTSIPWGIIGSGVGAIAAISLLASLIPAIQVARAQPLSLLQAGRASA